jgi:hypothetical protein
MGGFSYSVHPNPIWGKFDYFEVEIQDDCYYSSYGCCININSQCTYKLLWDYPYLVAGFQPLKQSDLPQMGFGCFGRLPIHLKINEEVNYLDLWSNLIKIRFLKSINSQYCWLINYMIPTNQTNSVIKQLYKAICAVTSCKNI